MLISAHFYLILKFWCYICSINNKIIDINNLKYIKMKTIILLVVFIIIMIIIWVKLGRYDLNWFEKTVIEVIVIIFIGYSYSIYSCVQKEINELEWCRNKMENGCKGWEILIIDKYHQEELRCCGKIFYTETVYYITYRYKEIDGEDKYVVKTDTVNKRLYDYYVVSKKYTNNCTFLTKDIFLCINNIN